MADRRDMGTTKILSTTITRRFNLDVGDGMGAGTNQFRNPDSQSRISQFDQPNVLTDANGVTLTGSGTNVATLDFGAVSQFTTPPPKVTQTVAATSFTVSTPFNVSVTKSNVTSANYALTAELQTTDAVNGWTIDTFPLTTVPAALPR